MDVRNDLVLIKGKIAPCIFPALGLNAAVDFGNPGLRRSYCLLYTSGSFDPFISLRIESIGINTVDDADGIRRPVIERALQPFGIVGIFDPVSYTHLTIPPDVGMP